ncbi:MAG: DMT family transporter [Clostridia bacterium]|nr:DMT family transporter [Clostridia bacterium]
MNEKPMKNELRSAGLLFLTAAIWGFAMAAQREGSRYLQPFTFNACRFTLGALILLPLMLRENRRDPVPFTGRQTVSGGLLGVILFIASLLQQSGVGEAGAGKAGFLTALYVVLVPVLGVFLGKKTRITTWLALLLALPALYLLCVPRDEAFSLAPWDGLLLAGAFFWASHILATDHFVKSIPALRLCVIQFVFGAVMNWLCALAFETVTGENLLHALVPVVYCGVMSTGVGYLCQTLGQKGTRPAVAALILSLESVFCVIAGALLLGERMDGRGYAGCALMLAAVLLAQLGALFIPEKEAKHV